MEKEIYLNSERNKIKNQCFEIPEIKNFLESNDLTDNEFDNATPLFLNILQTYHLVKQKYDFVLSLDYHRRVNQTFILRKNENNNLKGGYLISQEITHIDTNITLESLKDIHKKTPGFVALVSKFKSIAIHYTISNFKSNHNYLKCFYIYGNSGIGKSNFLKGIANFFVSKAKIVAFLNCVEFLEFCKNETKQRVYEFIRKVKTCDFLFLDDIGNETIYESFRDEILYSILSYRVSSCLPTFFGSSLSIMELERMESRSAFNVLDPLRAKVLVEKIKSLAEIIEIKGTNLRV